MSETIVPNALEAHAPKKFGKTDWWKMGFVVLLVSTVVSTTLAIVFGLNASQLSDELTTVKGQRTQVEDRLAALVVENRALETLNKPFYYIRRSEDLITSTLVAVDTVNNIETDLYTAKQFLDVVGFPHSSPNTLLLAVSADTGTGNKRIMIFDTETGEITSSEVFFGKGAVLSPDLNWQTSVSAVDGVLTFTDVVNGTKKIGATLAEGEYFYSFGGEFFETDDHFWINNLCVVAPIYTDHNDSTRDANQKVLKEKRLICRE